MNRINMQTRRIAQAAAAGALVLASSAHAALPEAVGTAIDTAKTDMTTALGLIIGAMVVVWGLRKLGQKLGWL